MGLVGAEFQVVFDLPPGVYQVGRCPDCSCSACLLLCAWFIAFVLSFTVFGTLLWLATSRSPCLVSFYIEESLLVCMIGVLCLLRSTIV
jgi:hypothetical protein